MTRLLPCPFCGGRSLDATCRETESSETGFYYVFCETCEACGPTDYDQMAAVALWNQRKEPEEA